MPKNQEARSTSLSKESTGSSSHVPVPSLQGSVASARELRRSMREDSSEQASASQSLLDRGTHGVRARTAGAGGHSGDGRLALWQDVASEEAWRDLLLGNGFSSHIWPAFAYGSLYARACRAGMLKSSDRELFEASATENFESVLGALAISIRTLETLGEPAAERLRTRYLRIQGALGAAVRGVHVPLGALSAGTREAVRSTLRGYRWVFSISYDLVLYWCAGYGESFDGFADLFFCNERLEFNPAKTAVEPDTTRLVYLHGALHLLVDGNGVARKRRSHAATLLEQFGEPDKTDSLVRPLLVAEGTAREKSRIIKENDYLSFGLNQLRRGRRGLVIFGLGLRDEDAHLVSAVNFRAKRPIAVGMRPRGRRENRRRQARIRALLDADQVFFFDSSTHPLGVPVLATVASGPKASD
jgi:hypothetical protein